jgi:hypothetical protein
MRRRLLLVLKVVLVRLGPGLLGVLIGFIWRELVGDPAGRDRRRPRRRQQRRPSDGDGNI